MVLQRAALPGTHIYTDYFRGDRGAVYILSHCHTDHMDGLCPGWDRGELYCSELIAGLLASVHGIEGAKGMPFDTPFLITEHVTNQSYTVTLIDAGHCPGSAIVVLDDPVRGCATINTGDFRFYPGLSTHLTIQRVRGNVRTLFIDGSWADPSFPNLPTKQESCDALCRFDVACEEERVVLHSSGIGDEEVLEALVNEFPGDRFLVLDEKRFKALQVTHASLVDSGVFTQSWATTPRFVLVKNHAQRVSLRSQIPAALEINPSTLWWSQFALQSLQDEQFRPVLCRRRVARALLHALELQRVHSIPTARDASTMRADLRSDLNEVNNGLGNTQAPC